MLGNLFFALITSLCLGFFAPDSGTPVLAAARLQRWSLLLSSYQYSIEYRFSTDITNADALSRLPLGYSKDESIDGVCLVSKKIIDNLPVSAQKVATKTAHFLSFVSYTKRVDNKSR